MNELYSAIDASKKWMSPLLCDGTSHAGTPCVVQDIVPFMSQQYVLFPIHTKWPHQARLKLKIKSTKFDFRGFVAVGNQFFIFYSYDIVLKML